MEFLQGHWTILSEISVRLLGDLGWISVGVLDDLGWISLRLLGAFGVGFL
jgi:hypothetical protein